MTTGKVVRAVVVVVAIIAAVVIVRLRPDVEAHPTSQPLVAESNSTSSTSVVDGKPTAERRSESAPWQRTARSFISRYPNTRGGRSAWLARLRPVVSEDLYRSLKTVRLANLPSGTFGQGQIQQTAEIGGVMRFPARDGDEAAVDVTVSVSDRGRLRVTGFEPIAGGGVQ